MPTSVKGKDGPKKQGPRLQDRPFNAQPLAKPAGMQREAEAVWDETVEAMPDGYFTSGDMRPLQGYCVAVAGWLMLLGDIEANGRIDGVELTESKLERALRAEFTGLAKMLGIMAPLERRMAEERPKGALALLDAHRGKAS